MFCTNCGNQNADNAQFCVKCGAPLVAAPVQQSVVSEVPPVVPVQESAQQFAPSASVEPQSTPLKKSMVLMTIGIVVLVLALVIGGFLAAKQLGVFGASDSSVVSAQTLTWQEQYDLGVRYIGEGNYAEAIIAFEAAIAIDPKKPEAYIALADVYIATDDLEKALEVLAQGEEATAGDESIADKKADVEALLENTTDDVQGDAPDLTDPTVVSFNDAKMEKMIRMAMGKPEGDITQGELNGITELHIYGEGYAEVDRTVMSVNPSYDGEFFELIFADETKETLAVQVGTLADVSDLEKMPYLTTLQILENQVSDITSLAGLTNLTFLELYGNQISDITPLVGLTNLTFLELSANPISDITSITGLTQLTGLYLLDNQISDLAPLAGLVKLESLGLYGNQISDLTPLAGLANLTGVSLGENQISDLAPLSGLTNLTVLILSDNQISNIIPLAGLTQLTELSLHNNQISDVTPLAGLTNLFSLSLYGNDITDLSPVEHVENLGA